MRFIALFETARRNRIGENKKCFFSSEFSVEPFDEKMVFVIQHRLETNAADIAARRPINFIAECHVVGRLRLSDRARCATDAKESARYFLASPNLGERPVLGRI